MKRPLQANGLAPTSHPGAARFAAALLCGLFALVTGCTGNIGGIPSGSGGASNTGGAAGSGRGVARRQVAWARARPGRAAAVSAGIPTRSRRSPPAASSGGDAPGGAAQPAAMVEHRPRSAQVDGHLRHRQRRDGDALIGFDNEADALFVTEQLRAQLFDASEKLADKVTGDATALGAPRPRERAHGRGRQGQGLHHVVRTARLPAAAHGRGGDHARRALQSSADALSRGRCFQGGREPGHPGDAAVAAIFLYRTELGTAPAGATKVAAQRLGGGCQARALDHQHDAGRHAVRRRGGGAAPRQRRCGRSSQAAARRFDGARWGSATSICRFTAWGPTTASPAMRRRSRTSRRTRRPR